MNRSGMLIGAVLVAAGCGKQSDEARNTAKAIEAVATAGPKMEAGMQEAERFQKERVAKGDTVARPYPELQKALPGSIDGYQARESPGGSQQAMGGFSMSQAEQTWVKAETGPDGTPEIKVAIVDFGGTQQGYAMLAAPILMGFSQEDAHRRVGSTKIDVPYSGAWEEFDKDTKDAKITVVTRYRYVITVEAHHAGDQTATVKRLAEETARKFDGK